MKQQVLEKISIKIIATILFLFLTIVLIGAVFYAPQLIRLQNKIFYFFLLLLVGVFFFLYFVKILYHFVMNTPPKYHLAFALSCFAVIFVLQIIVIKVFEIRPIEDLDRVTNMAIDIINGKKFTFDNTYFGMYTNNIPFTIYLSKYFNLLIKLGFRNYVIAGSLLGVLSLDFGLLFTSLLLKEIKNGKAAIFFLVFNVFNPLIYLWGTFFYTTIIAIPFMMFSLYILVTLNKKTNPFVFYLKLILLTASLYIGTQIRATTIFVLIAAVIVWIIRFTSFSFDKTAITIKKLTLGIFISLCCIVLLNLNYKNMQNEVMAADYSQTSFPPTHWIMMGLQGKGGYNWNDEVNTFKRPTREDKKSFTKRQIRKRIDYLGLTGLSKLTVNKLIYNWSDGSHDYPVIMRASHNYTRFHKYIFGEKRELFIVYCQVFNVVILIFSLLKMLHLIRKENTSKSLILYITLFGSFLFHLLWEANPKYSLNFIMIIMLIAIDSMEELFCLETISQAMNRIISGFGAIFTLLTLILSFVLYPNFTKDNIAYKDMVQGQIVANRDRITDINQGASFYQSFKTRRPFNNITIEASNNSSSMDAVYQFYLLDENKVPIYSSNFSPSTKDKVESVSFDFDTVKPKIASTYYIKISSNHVKAKDSVDFRMSGKPGYDVFPHGELTINDCSFDGDLAFKVTDNYKATFTSTYRYLLVILIILMSELAIFIYYKRQLQQNKENSESFIL